MLGAVSSPSSHFLSHSVCRGGGGGTYGIVVEATVKVIEVPVVTLAHIGYSKMTHAVDILDR